MVELPSGMVTLLFSDMEGSTRLLDRLGDRYAEVLLAQRRVLRQAWADHRGVELGTEGDSFFVVFSAAADAVAAAVAGQRAVAGLEFDEADRPRVRMGLHTGSPAQHDGGYVGMDVHRGARVAGVAHGGQIVVSDTVAFELGQSEAVVVELVDLGSHQLKDLPALEQLWQVAAEGVGREFPPVRSLGATTGLPVARTPLVGRDGELDELAALVRSHATRLVTLTGPGGSGKTRLATAVAERTAASFGAGVFFVPLVTATNEHTMWTTIADALNLPPDGRVPPGFFQHVAHRQTLLVLDNLEQVDGADSVVSQLLEHGSELVVVATSRSPLHLRGEHEHPVPPLELPESDGAERVAEAGAVRLFVQHAQMVRPSFALTADNAAAVAEVCRRLDGLPLAVELAAARVKLLSPQALVKRLDQSLDLSSRGADRPSRQQTLRDTIAWSYDLLPEGHQRFFDALGVFVGGADLGTVEAIVGGDGVDVFDAVSALVDASLVTLRETDDGEPWLDLLVTIRAFAVERLEATGRLDEVQRRHAEYFRDVALRDMQFGRRGENASISPAPWRLAHADNLRAALTWAFRPDRAHDPSRIDTGLVLVCSTGRIWRTGHLLEGLEWARKATTTIDGRQSEAAIGCLNLAAELSRLLGRVDDSLEYARQSVALSAAAGDPYLEAESARSLALSLTTVGDLDEARSWATIAVTMARSADSSYRLTACLQMLAHVEASEGNLEAALQLDRAILDLAIESGSRTTMMAQRQNIGSSLRQLGRPDEAFEELASIAVGMLAAQDSDAMSGYCEDLACIVSDLGHFADAARLVGAVEAFRDRSGAVRPAWQQEEIKDSLDRSRAAMGDGWQSAYDDGAQNSINDEIDRAIAAVRQAP